jgi:hypothetical protein
MSRIDPCLHEYYIEKEMHNYKQAALRKVATVTAHQHVEDFAKMIYFGWQEGHPSAEKITNNLDLFPIDFMAIVGNVEEFENLLIAEKESELFYGEMY